MKMLEIGTVLYLKNGTQKVMVLSRGAIIQKNGKEKRYDYSACLYPSGLNPEELFYFNEENIDSVLFKGYHDEDEDRFQSLYEKWILQVGDTIEKGSIEPINNRNDVGFD